MLRQQLRSKLKQQRCQLDEASRQQVSQSIIALLRQTSIYQNAHHIGCYLAHQGEVPTQTMIQALWQDAKSSFVPVVQSAKTMTFVRYTPQTKLNRNHFSILEPEVDPKAIIAPQQLDLVLTPLVAFDTKGVRIGMGGGYYDGHFQFLNTQSRPSKPLLIGLAYEFQKYPHLSAHSHDVLLNGVLTEQQLYWFNHP
jgi:5-formyltetrahydrofolate cyclo-ligase